MHPRVCDLTSTGCVTAREPTPHQQTAHTLMKYDPTKPEPDYNTLKVGLYGLAMAALLIAIYLSIAISLFHAANIPMR